MSQINRPTKKQKEVLSFIEGFIAGNGYGPSYREIRAGLGYKSIATVALHVDNLIAKGYLKKADNKARSLELVDRPAEDLIADKKIKPSDEKWLVKQIEDKFKQAENETPSKQMVDDLYVLVGALKVLGLEGAYNSFLPRLKNIKEKQN